MIININKLRASDNYILWIKIFITTHDKHYYDEDNIEIGKASNVHVVINHVVELTAEEKEQARKDAIKKVQDEAYKKMTQPIKKTKKSVSTPQPNLFDF